MHIPGVHDYEEHDNLGLKFGLTFGALLRNRRFCGPVQAVTLSSTQTN
jgi:hypothetical protein